MGAVIVGRAELQHAVLRAANGVADAIRDLPDTGIRIQGSDWTIGEAAAHLAISKGLVAKIVRGDVPGFGEDLTLEALPSVNARHLAEFPERDGARLADLLVQNTRSFLEAAAACPDTQTVSTPIGTMDVATLRSYMLTHLLMHGCSIAKALRKPYPVRPRDVELALPFLRYAMSRTVSKQRARGVNACFEVRLRGGSRFAIMFDNGDVSTAHVPSRRVDCHVYADPVALFLLGNGLESQWPLIARGKLMTWGRRPWMALKLAGYFARP